MAKIKIADKSVIKTLGFCGSGIGANPASVDVLGDRIVRVRPLHYDQNYSKENLRSYKIEKDGHVFEPGFKSFLPPLSLAYKNRTYSPNRVPYPLIREDWDPHGQRNPQTRGISKYRRISWDEATDIIASELKRIHDTYGPHSVYCQGEGHGETKNYSGGHGCQQQMLSLIGGCTIQARQPDSWEGWYWGAKHIWGMDPVGENSHQNNVFKDITENGDAILYWGADPETTPWGWGGQQASRMCYWFNEIGVKSIFICPDLNYANAVHADKWIPVLPNTDAALQLAVAYVWITEDLYDKAYIATHADGFDWFEQHVLGIDDGIPKTPKWAESKTGIKSYTIKALARYWAKSAVSIAHCNGGGMVRSVFSHEPARLEVALLGMQGLGKPGANQFKYIEWTIFDNPNFSPIPYSETFPSLMSMYHGWDLGRPMESFVCKTLLPDAIMNPPVEWYGHVVCLYPRPDQFEKFEFPLPGDAGIKMIWSDAPCWSTCWNGGNKMQDALRHESVEFILMQHPWMENDTVFGDIILPVASIMECEDLGMDCQAGQFNLFYYEEPASGQIGESLSDYQCVVEVAKKLEKYGGKYEDLAGRYTEHRSKDEWLEFGFANSGVPDISLEQLKEQQFWASPIIKNWQEQPAGLIQFHDDPEAFPLETPTGKLEYYSVDLATHFPDDDIRGPYPKWIEESDVHQERIHSERAKDYPYLLVSNHPRWRVHANCDDIPWLREISTCKVIGPDGYAYEPVWIHPSDAVKYDIKDGDVVKLFNERGIVLGGAKISERIMPGALYQDHGARIDSVTAGTGGIDRGGANNLICPSGTSSKNAPGEVTNGFLVGLGKVDALELAKLYPEQFGRDYDPAFGLVASAYIVDGD